MLEEFERFEELMSLVDPESIRERIRSIEEVSTSPDFWKDTRKAQELMSELSHLKSKLETIDKLRSLKEELEILSEFIHEDVDFYKEYESKLSLFRKALDEFELQILLSSKEDRGNAILEIHPGAGGTESHDWAQMLMRMYIRWMERKGFKYEILDMLPGEEAGIKSVSILVKGEYAYGLLKSEVGVHRLVRISPFDASNRRHTSFASVFVYPEMEEIQVEIREEDLKIETMRSSGAGGQHVNKTESAVRITHIPTGITVIARNERSQHRNREIAMKILRSKLYQYYKQKEMEKLQKLEEQKTDIAWGHQIRSYILHPYKLVKDHRTGYEVSNVEAVLDGDIDEFIRKYLLSKLRKAV